jgi:archaellum component FlaC
LVQKEAKQKRAHLHVDDIMVIHRDIKNDLNKVKANLENALSSWESMGGLEVF